MIKILSGLELWDKIPGHSRDLDCLRTFTTGLSALSAARFLLLEDPSQCEPPWVDCSRSR